MIECTYGYKWHENSSDFSSAQAEWVGKIRKTKVEKKLEHQK